MPKCARVDLWIFVIALLLVFIGLIMIFSASAVMAQANPNYHSAYYFLIRQLAWASVGLVSMFMLAKADYRRYATPAVVFPILGLTITMLVVVFFFGRAHNTHRWIHAGHLSFQPSEPAKLALILFLAWSLGRRETLGHDWRTFVPPALVTIVLAVMIAAQPDLGTAMLCFAIAYTMLFVAGVRISHLFYPLALSPLAFYFLVWRVKWRWERVHAFLSNFNDLQGAYQIIQSLIAVGSGGLAGAGFMEGKQKLFYLPEPHTDFIFAVIAEEWGLRGSLAVVGCFAVFCYRGIRTAARTRDPFGRLLATGITSMIVMQALLNISVVLGMMPAKGIPLPFISYGGSSLFVTLAAVGVLLNITAHAN